MQQTNLYISLCFYMTTVLQQKYCLTFLQLTSLQQYVLVCWLKSLQPVVPNKIFDNMVSYFLVVNFLANENCFVFVFCCRLLCKTLCICLAGFLGNCTFVVVFFLGQYIYIYSCRLFNQNMSCSRFWNQRSVFLL